MDALVIDATARTKTGKGHSGRIRREGKIPVVIYGHGTHENASVNLHDFSLVMHHMKAEHAVVKLSLEEKELDVLIKDIQRDVVKHEIIHVDFLQVDMEELVTVTIPIEPEGEPEGVRSHGGVMEVIRRDIEIECKAKNIPDNIVIDVSGLDVHDNISVSDLPQIEGLTYLEEPDTTLITVASATVYEEPKESEEGLLEEPIEPEVIGEKKDEDEEGENA
jgi:large subunit ribosomal protein L25